MLIHRRHLLTGSLAAAAAWAALPAQAKVDSVPWEGNCEVVVIGSGGAGMATAVSARESGLKDVVVLEKLAFLGGNTGVATGSFNTWSPDQEKQGIQDSPEHHAAQTMQGGDYRNNRALVELLVHNTYPTFEWLVGMGMEFDPKIAQIYGGLWPRGHYPAKGKGIEYIKVLEKRAKELGGIDIRTNARVTGIVREKFLEGRVLGVEYADKDGKLHYLRAKQGVVAAAGGCCANGKMCGIHDPRLEKLTTTNIATASTGEILTMMEDLGAMTTGLDFIQCNPGCPPGRTFRTNFHSVPAWMIMVDKSGKRFVAEDARRDEIRDAILNIRDQTAFAVQDSNGFAHDAIGAQRDNRHALTTGDAWTDDTLEGLAKKMGVPVETFVATVKAYNKGCDEKKDEMGRAASTLNKIEKAPFWAGYTSMSRHFTCGGAVINTRFQVIDRHFRPIEGLYAVGETSAGVHGTNRLGGNAIAEIFTFGRLLGKELAQA